LEKEPLRVLTRGRNLISKIRSSERLEVSDMNVHMMPGVGAAVNMAAAVAVNMDVENNLAMNTLDGECACLEEEVCLHDSVAILMGDIESIVTDSDDLNSDREELEALISDLRSVLTEE